MAKSKKKQYHLSKEELIKGKFASASQNLMGASDGQMMLLKQFFNTNFEALYSGKPVGEKEFSAIVTILLMGYVGSAATNEKDDVQREIASGLKLFDHAVGEYQKNGKFPEDTKKPLEDLLLISYDVMKILTKKEILRVNTLVRENQKSLLNKIFSQEEKA